MEAFTDELRRCEQLEIPYLIMHPGSHMDSEPQQGLDKIAASIDRALKDSETSNTIVLLESTAGQGTNLGYTFEQLQYIIDKSTLSERVAVCIDTCHIFTAGYDIRDTKAWSGTKQKISSTVGLEKIKVFHMNDSKKEFGSKRDRHERIGQGEIGLEGFQQVVNDPDFRNIPMILEIPGGNEAYAEDIKLLRSLVKKKVG
jgi:deoxyribonuclease-4